MHFERLRPWLVSGLACLLLGCAGLPQPRPSAAPPAADDSESSLLSTYGALARAGGKLMRLDPAASSVSVYVFRGGSAARVGHNHVLSVPRFTGFFHLPPEGVRAARFDIAFRLDALEFDRPLLRATLGPAFASVLTPEMVEATRANMLGPDGLQADRFPLVRIASVALRGDAPRFAAEVRIALHGQQRRLSVPLEVQGLPDRLAAKGALVLRQSDFGIRPFSVLGGLLAVEDQLVVEFSLVGS